MFTITINWLHILAVVAAIGGVLGFVLFLGLLIGGGIYLTRRAKSSKPKSALVPFEHQPSLASNMTSVRPPAIDPHELAAAVAAHLEKAAPPVVTPPPNHPAVAAVSELVTAGNEASSKLQQIAALAGTIQSTAAPAK